MHASKPCARGHCRRVTQLIASTPHTKLLSLWRTTALFCVKAVLSLADLCALQRVLNLLQRKEELQGIRLQVRLDV